MSNLNNNFWKWFNKSKVVDKKGNPLIVYHGSPKNDIEVFEPSRGSNVNAIYFSDNLSVAAHWSGNSSVKRKKIEYNSDNIDELLRILNFYTKATIEYVDFEDGRFYRLETYGGDMSSPLGYKKDENTYILRGKEYDLRDRLKREIDSFADDSYNSSNYGCYLSIQKPLIVDAKKKSYHRIEFNGDIVSTEQLVVYAQKNGYDGVIVKNVYETDYENILCNDYIVFNSNQIKSIDNNGNWSNSNNIYESFKKETAMNITSLLRQLISKATSKEKIFYDEMEDETGMNKVSENVVSMFDYKYKQEDLMEKFIRKFLKDDDYYTLYKSAKMFSSMNKLYLEKNLNVKLSDKEYNELKDDLKHLVRLGDEALNEEVSSAQLGSAPTPALGQVTVNGKPWTSGKSYKAKRKKKVKESFLIKLNNMLNETEFGTIPQKIGQWLDKLNFKNVYTRNNIVYEKEGNYRHIISYNNQEDVLKYLILNDGDVVYNDSWQIDNAQDVNQIFGVISKEYERHE